VLERSSMKIFSYIPTIWRLILLLAFVYLTVSAIAMVVDENANILAYVFAFFMWWVGSGVIGGVAKFTGAFNLKGPTRGAKLQASPSTPRDGLKMPLDGLEIMSHPIKPRAEGQHFLFTGSTGTGKTQAINKFLKVIRARNDSALLGDAAGGFYSRFSRPGDLLFNPFDARSVNWSPFAEIREPYDCQRLAAAIIPQGSGSSAEWNQYARTLLAETLLALHSAGERSVKMLLHCVSAAQREELESLLGDTPAAILAAEGNEKMLGSTRAIIGTYLAAWQYLPDEGDFSFRDWIRQEEKGWLFITYRDDQVDFLKRLVATVFDLAITETLSLDESSNRDLWFVLDEADTLGKVGALRGGLTKLRKYGGKVLLGIQTIAQLRDTYGHDEAQTLLANMGTKLILRAGDNETAAYLSREIGDEEITRTQISESKKTSDLLENSRSTTEQILRQSLVMPSEIMGLQDLHGYVKSPTGSIIRGELAYEAIPQTAKPYVSKQEGVTNAA
jgi:hypothetical protein